MPLGSGGPGSGTHRPAGPDLALEMVAVVRGGLRARPVNQRAGGLGTCLSARTTLSIAGRANGTPECSVVGRVPRCSAARGRSLVSVAGCTRSGFCAVFLLEAQRAALSHALRPREADLFLFGGRSPRHVTLVLAVAAFGQVPGPAFHAGPAPPGARLLSNRLRVVFRILLACRFQAFGLHPARHAPPA